MATQGLLSITRDGKVVAKIVTGSDGYYIPDLAKALRKKPTTTATELMRMAKSVGLGGCSLIVQTAPDVFLSDDDNPDELPELYKTKFHESRFNPRWANGTCEYTEVVEINKK